MNTHYIYLLFRRRNGGNDLQACFTTRRQAEHAMTAEPSREGEEFFVEDWPLWQEYPGWREEDPE